MGNTLISTEKQARETEDLLAELNRALSTEQVLKTLAQGLPHEAMQRIRRSLEIERNERQKLLVAYQRAKSGDFSLLRKCAGNDLGAFLVAARIVKGLSQKDLARKLGLKEQAIQRWEAEKYRSITLSNYLKVAQTLGVHWQLEMNPLENFWPPSYDVSKEQLSKVVRHAQAHGWLEKDAQSEENAIATLVRYVGDHVIKYGTPSLLRTGLSVQDHSQDWSLLSWKAHVTRQAEAVIEKHRPRFRLLNIGWLSDLVKLSQHSNGPQRARELLLENGIVVIAEPQIAGMSIDGAAFLAGDTPVIGMTLLRDTLDNFWFTLVHEVGHIVLHYHTGLSEGFFDDVTVPSLDELEAQANEFAQDLLIPDELWKHSPARIAKTPEPIKSFANQLGIHPAIVFGRIRLERKNYSLFSDKIGRGTVRQQLLGHQGATQ